MLGRILPRRKRRHEAILNSRAVNRSKELAPVLERERARADRSRYELTLVLLGLDGKPNKSSAGLAKLVTVIETRCRITDVVGEFDQKTAFILLPDTAASGARHFSETIQAVMRRHGVETSYAIYNYASASTKDRKPPNDNDGGSGRGGSLRERVPEAAVARRIAKQKDDHPKAPVATKASMVPTHELKQAMVRPLPIWKRVTDVLVAGVMLVLLWPLLVTIGIMIKLESKGPAVFRQQRAGLGGHPFGIYKFRTMVDGAERIRDDLLHINEHKGPAFKIKNDPRITRLGNFLRKTSLDELPQLINVIRGEMTLVGPRPLPCYEADNCQHWQQRRVDVTPGLTCIWQVSGRSQVDFDEWVRMDLAYQRNRTLGHDMRILFATVPAVLTQHGAH